MNYSQTGVLAGVGVGVGVDNSVHKYKFKKKVVSERYQSSK